MRRAALLASLVGLAALLATFSGLALASSPTNDGVVVFDTAVSGANGPCTATLRLTPLSSTGLPQTSRAIDTPLGLQQCGSSALPTTATISAAPGRYSALLVSSSSGAALDDAVIFDGACDTKGELAITAGELTQCSLTVYPLFASYSVLAGPQVSTRIVQVTERIVPGQSMTSGATQTVLCDIEFKLGLIAGDRLTNDTASVRACQPDSEQLELGNAGAVSAQTNLGISEGSGSGRLEPLGVEDDFDVAGFVTTYSDGCATAAEVAGAQLETPAAPVTCTITHTYVGSTGSTHDALLEVDSSIAGSGSVCGLTLVASVSTDGKAPVAGPSAPLCPGGAATASSSPTALLGIAPGTATLAVKSSAALQGKYAQAWGGGCAADATITLAAGQAASCTLTLYPLAASLDLIPSGPLARTHLVQVTEAIVGAAASSPSELDQELCQTYFRLGSLDAERLDPATSATPICAGQLQNAAVSGLTVSATANVELTYMPHSDGSGKLGISDTFVRPGFVTTYSAGCSYLADGVGGYAASADPLTCTITHTDVGAAAAADDGLIEVDSSVSGSGGSICQAALHVTVLAPGATPTAKPVLAAADTPTSAECASTPLPVSGSTQIAVPAGTATISVISARPGSLDAFEVLGGDCAADGTVTVRAGTLAKCTLALYPDAADYALNSDQPQARRLLAVTERIVNPVGAPLASWSSVLCQTYLRAGILTGSTGSSNPLFPETPAVGACAQTHATTSGSALSSVSSIELTYGARSALRFGVSDNFDQPGFVTTYSDGCSQLLVGIAQLVTPNDPLTCTITHTFFGKIPAPAPPPPSPVPASTTSVSCPLAGSAAGIDGTMSCSVTVTAPSGAPAPSGTVTVTPGNETCDISTDPCDVTVPTSSTVGAQETVSASFPGQSGLGSSTGSTAVTLTLRPTAIAMQCATDGQNEGVAVSGEEIICTLTVSDLYDPDAFTPGGTVQATAGADTEQCSLNPESQSCMVFLTSGLTSPASITSSYAGDGAEFAASTGSEAISVVAPA